MINTRTIKYDGRQRNHQNGLTFYFTRQGQVLNFLIDIIGDRKRKVKVTMHADMNHGRPHVHIGDHEASFAVDSGELIVGNCDAKTRKLMKNWIARHKEDLLQLWDTIKRGERYQPIVQRINQEMSFDSFDFTGVEPQYRTEIDGAVIWHDEKLLVERQDDGRLLVIGAGDIYVGVPEDYPEDHTTFVSVDGEVQKSFRAT